MRVVWCSRPGSEVSQTRLYCVHGGVAQVTLATRVRTAPCAVVDLIKNNDET